MLMSVDVGNYIIKRMDPFGKFVEDFISSHGWGHPREPIGSIQHG